MFLGIVIAAYLAYLALGVLMQYTVGYVDWSSPYWHYAKLPTDNAWPAFVIPGALALIVGYNWYQKSMIGEP